eukprot:4382367-Pleurochrysis_carterae.AAC.2
MIDGPVRARDVSGVPPLTSLRTQGSTPLNSHTLLRDSCAYFTVFVAAAAAAAHGQADHESGGALETLQHMNLRELVMMLKEGHMMDDVVLDSAQVLKIFQ